MHYELLEAIIQDSIKKLAKIAQEDSGNYSAARWSQEYENTLRLLAMFKYEDKFGNNLPASFGGYLIYIGPYNYRSLGSLVMNLKLDGILPSEGFREKGTLYWLICDEWI